MGLVVTEPLRRGEESTAAIAKVVKVPSRMASSSTRRSRLRCSQPESKDESSGAMVRLTQCYCGGCRFSSRCIGPLISYLEVCLATGCEEI